MAINVTFNGATIYKPGAYSEEIIDLGGGFPGTSWFSGRFNRK